MTTRVAPANAIAPRELDSHTPANAAAARSVIPARTTRREYHATPRKRNPNAAISAPLWLRHDSGIHSGWIELSIVPPHHCSQLR